MPLLSWPKRQPGTASRVLRIIGVGFVQRAQTSTRRTAQQCWWHDQEKCPVDAEITLITGNLNAPFRLKVLGTFPAQSDEEYTVHNQTRRTFIQTRQQSVCMLVLPADRETEIPKMKKKASSHKHADYNPGKLHNRVWIGKRNNNMHRWLTHTTVQCFSQGIG